MHFEAQPFWSHHINLTIYSVVFSWSAKAHSTLPQTLPKAENLENLPSGACIELSFEFCCPWMQLNDFHFYPYHRFEFHPPTGTLELTVKSKSEDIPQRRPKMIGKNFSWKDRSFQGPLGLTASVPLEGGAGRIDLVGVTTLKLQDPRLNLATWAPNETFPRSKGEPLRSLSFIQPPACTLEIKAKTGSCWRQRETRQDR